MLFQKYGIHQNKSVLTYRENSEKLNEIKDLWYQFYFHLHVHYISAKNFLKGTRVINTEICRRSDRLFLAHH